VIRVRQIRQFRRHDGQTMAEYAVMLGVITATLVATFGVFSTSVTAALARAAELVGLAGG
jgi:Flp pilus assembly pilin Flp